MIAHIFKLTQGCLCLSHFPIHNVNNKSTGTSTNNTVYARIHKCPDWPQGSYLLFVSGEQIECGAWHIHSQQMSGSLRAESLISMTEGPEHHLPPLRRGAQLLRASHGSQVILILLEGHIGWFSNDCWVGGLGQSPSPHHKYTHSKQGRHTHLPFLSEFIPANFGRLTQKIGSAPKKTIISQIAISVIAD